MFARGAARLPLVPISLYVWLIDGLLYVGRLELNNIIVDAFRCFELSFMLSSKCGD